MKLINGLFGIVCALLLFCGCDKTSNIQLKTGGLYSIKYSKDKYAVAKLLHHENSVCHLRIYQQMFDSRPKTVDPAKLTLGERGKPKSGTWYSPFQEKSFRRWEPEFISIQPVSPEELEGYKVWKENGSVEAF